jgi:hypothetical protein
MVAEIVVVIDSLGEGEVFRYGRCCDTGFGESGDGRLALFELGAEGTEEPPGLSSGLAGAAIRLPDASVASPVGDEFSAENVLNTDYTIS